jgi:patatin-like phospholipase/acyl hydrolase
MPTKILSIDGGGIRGVIPATVLDHIEKTVGRPIAELFDVIAGTSTGGLIALGLTCPGDAGRPKFTAEEIVSIYVDDGARILPARAVRADPPVLRGEVPRRRAERGSEGAARRRTPGRCPDERDRHGL